MAKSMTRKIKPDFYDRKRQRQRERTHILYRCYDRTLTLLYVGMTNDPESRFIAHRNTQPWWHQVDHIRIQKLKSREALARAEAAAIQMEQPLYNIHLANSASKSDKKAQLPTARKFAGGRGHRLFPEANHFFTREPQQGHLIDMTREQMLYPCSQCKVRAISCEGNIVSCRMCGAQWSYDRWFADTFLDVDEYGQMRLL